MATPISLLPAATTFGGTERVPLVQGGATKYGTPAQQAAYTFTGWGALVAAGTSKATPVDGDSIALSDSAAGGATKRLTWANLKATLATHFNTLYGAGTQPFDVHAFLPGLQTSASQIIVRVKLARAVGFAANFSGSYFGASANATGSTVFDVQKNGVSIGTVTIGAGGTTPTFATSGGAAQTFAAGDLFAIIGPASADATLADCGFTFAGTR